MKTDLSELDVGDATTRLFLQDFPSNVKMEGTVDFSMCQVANVGIAVTVALRTDSIRAVQATGQSGI